MKKPFIPVPQYNEHFWQIGLMEVKLGRRPRLARLPSRKHHIAPTGCINKVNTTHNTRTAKTGTKPNRGPGRAPAALAAGGSAEIGLGGS